MLQIITLNSLAAQNVILFYYTVLLNKIQL